MTGNQEAGISSEEYPHALDQLAARLAPDVAEQWPKEALPEHLLRHLRERTHPRLLFSPAKLPEIAALARRHDPDESRWEQEIADNAVAGRLYGASNAYCRRFLEVDRKTFDFSAYDHPDPQTIHGLNRQRWMASLAWTYWLEQNPEYFHALMREWDFYAANVPLPGRSLYRQMHGAGSRTRMRTPYHELDNFIRLKNWWWAFWLALHAPEMTPERCAVLLSRCLRLFDMVAARGIRDHRHNFTAMQMESVYLWACALPEISGMDVWQSFARNTDEAALVRAVYDDGVHWEKSVGYHSGCIYWYATPFLMGRRNDDPWAEEYGERLRKMGRYLEALVLPDGTTPPMSDSDRVATWKRSLPLLRILFPTLAFRFPVPPTFHSIWAGDGTVWKPTETVCPAHESATVFPDGGVAVARSAEDRSMALLDNGPTDAGHSHTDNLTVYFEARGEPILVDPGRAVYRQDAERAWVTSAQSHNTVCPEQQQPQDGEYLSRNAFVRLGPTDPRLGPVTIRETRDTAVMRASFRGFAEPTDAVVERVVVFSCRDDDPWLLVADRIRSNAPHQWTTSWLLPASQAPAETGENERLVSLASGTRVVCRWTATHALQPTDTPMFWFPTYGERESARWLRWTGTCGRGSRAFGFKPLAPGESADIPAFTLEEKGAVVYWGGIRVSLDERA